MSKFNLKGMNYLFPVEDVDTISGIDAAEVSSEPKEYVKVNRLGYFTLLNTWLTCIQEYSKAGEREVESLIRTQGLLSTIRFLNEDAGALIRGTGCESNLTRCIEQDVKNAEICGKPLPIETKIGSSATATTLFLLRFPKRFSPVGADRILAESIEDFLEVNELVRENQHVELPPFMVKRIQDVILKCFPWGTIVKRIRKLEPYDYEFTTGAGRDSKATKGSKLIQMGLGLPGYFPKPFRCEVIPQVQRNTMSYYGRGTKRPDEPELTKEERCEEILKYSSENDEKVPDPRGCTGYDMYHHYYEVHPVRVMAVPKSYKAARIVAKEDTVRQCKARAIFSILDDYLPEGIPIHRQEENQEWAYEGSMVGDMATLDQSHASDLIRVDLMKEIFPSEFIEELREVIPTHMEFSKKDRWFTRQKSFIRDDKEHKFRSRTRNGVLMHSYVTAGNAMTFPLESIVFWATVVAAYAYVQEICGFPVNYTRNYYLSVPCRVYGDDIICPTDLAATVEDWLARLGFIANLDKSFSSRDLPYRESCGKEYYEGEDLTSSYFPRFPIEGEISSTEVKLLKSIETEWLPSLDGSRVTDSTSRLIDLQHKLFRICIPASQIVSELIRSAHPEMTSSTYLDNGPDLHAFVEDATYCGAPKVQQHPLEITDLRDWLLRDSKSAKPLGLRFKRSDAGYWLYTTNKSYGQWFACKSCRNLNKSYQLKTLHLGNGDTVDMRRELHSACVAAYPQTKYPRSADDYVAWDNYNHFIHEGPRVHDDPWIRLIGGTMPNPSTGKVCSMPDCKWELIEL